MGGTDFLSRRKYSFKVFMATIFILFFLVGTTVIYTDRLSTRTMEDEFAASTEVLLEGAAGELQRLFDTLLSIAIEAYYSPTGTEFRTAPEFDPILSSRLQRELVHRKSSFAFIQAIIMANRRTDDLVSTGLASSAVDSIVQTALVDQLSGGYNQRFYITTTRVRGVQGSESVPVLLFIFSDEHAPGVPVDNYVVLSVYADSIAGSFRLGEPSQGRLTVYDAGGKILLPVPDGERSNGREDDSVAPGIRPGGAEVRRVIAGKETLLVSTSIDKLNWTLVRAMPMDNIDRTIRRFQLTYAMFVGVLSLLSIVAAYISSRLLYRPITRLLRLTRTATGSDQAAKGDMEYLETTVLALKDERDSILIESEQSREALRQELLRSLMDETIPPDLYERVAATLSLAEGVRSIEVVLITRDEPAPVPDAVHDIFVHRFSEVEIDAVPYDEEVVAVVMAHADQIPESAIVAELDRALQEPGSPIAGCTIAVGGTVSSINDIPVSAQQAFYLLRYRIVGGNDRVLTLGAVSDRIDTTFVYPSDLEADLVRSLKVGDRSAFDDTITRVFEYCATHSYDVFQHVTIRMVLELLSCVTSLQKQTKSTEAVDIKGLLRRIYSVRSRREYGMLLGNVFGLYQSLDDARHEDLATSAAALVERVNDFVDRELSNPQLSVELIANHFGYSASYFGTIYSSHAGVTLSKRITEVRMHVAERLLATTNDSAKSIALNAGYTNTNYFYSTFKRQTGLTPTEYRKVHRRRA